MTNSSDYTPPKVWTWIKPNGGQFASINRPIAGPTHDKELPVGRHPLQLYSLATPNGQKVTIMLEELLALGKKGAEYDAWLIRIGEGAQFGSGFVAINPNSKIPAMVDRSGEKPIRIFPACAGFSLLGGVLFAGLFAYVNVSPLLFMQGYGVSKTGFAGLFAITASGVIVGSSINAWLISRHVSPKNVLDAALTLECLSGLALLMVGLAGFGSALVDAALVMVFISAFGLVFPNAVHEAIHPLPEIAGLASAVVTTTQMLFGALGGVTAAALYRNASPTALGAIMTAAALSAGALYAFWLRGKVEG